MTRTGTDMSSFLIRHSCSNRASDTDNAVPETSVILSIRDGGGKPQRRVWKTELKMEAFRKVMLIQEPSSQPFLRQ